MRIGRKDCKRKEKEREIQDRRDKKRKDGEEL
jgi:hypothetical protein